MATRNRLMEIYQALGRVLDDPAAFGLGYRVPMALADVLATSRRSLMEELTEQRRSEEEERSLDAELSQDADTRFIARNAR